MVRKLFRLNDREPHTQKGWIFARRSTRRRSASRGQRKSWFADSILSVERLEDRYMLAANPVLSLESNQFFGAGGSFTPFRATFTDVVSDASPIREYTINWGDGSPDDTGIVSRFTSDGPACDSRHFRS